MSDRILISIVDDDEPFRESMRRLLRSLGYTVDAYSSATDFLASPRLGDTSCLIADLHMPGMTGLELFGHLGRAGHSIPTILVTAYPRSADRVSALNEGVLCYLPKPVDLPSLTLCLRAALASGGAPK